MMANNFLVSILREQVLTLEHAFLHCQVSPTAPHSSSTEILLPTFLAAVHFLIFSFLLL